MANKQLAEAAQKVIQDQQFNAWLKSIGDKGQKEIKKLFVKTVKEDQKLAAMAKEDPQSTMILFAYQIYQQQSKQNNAPQNENSQEPQNVEPEEQELEDMNNPPLTSPISAKFGSKLNHIIKLNGHCPEGYEIQYYSMGGHLCGKCRKKKQMLMQNMACGGKKRIKKGQLGLNTQLLETGRLLNLQNANRIAYDRMLGQYTSHHKLAPQKESNTQTANGQSSNGKVVDTYDTRNFTRRQQLQRAYEQGLINADKLNEALQASEQLLEKEQQEYQNFPSLDVVRMIQDPVERKRMEEEFWKRYEQRYQQSYKKGGKTLTKAKANSLKYKGGPGDINSTEGMKPNKKQKKMLTRKVGGMVKNAKKITIYGQPDMFDYIKY